MAICTIPSPMTDNPRLSRSAPLLVALLSLLFALVTFAPPAAAKTKNFAGVKIGDASLDHRKVDGRRWTRIDFKPKSSGTHTIRINSRSKAIFRFSVFRIDESRGRKKRVRVGTTYGTGKPRQWTGKLKASKRYFLGVWSAKKSGYFTATLEPEKKTANSRRNARGNANARRNANARNNVTPRSNVNRPIPVRAANSWQIKGTAKAVVATGRTLFVGGDFSALYNNSGGSLPRTNLAAIDRYTGEPTGFSPRLDGEVWALALSPNKKTLYVGGSFMKVEGITRKRIAAFDVKTGELTGFVTPTPNNVLRAIDVDNKKVYLGGMFTRMGDKRRMFVAAVDARTGKLDHKFVASPDKPVKTLALGPNRLWVGGNFNRLNGARQKGIGALDPNTGSRRPTGDVSYPVIDLAVSDSQVFVAGGGPGGRAAAFNRATGARQWQIASDGNFQAVAVDKGRYVYFGGHYETIAGNPRVDRLTRHDKRTGKTDVSWLPTVNGIRSINAIDVTSDGLYIGGDFTRIGPAKQRGVAIVPGKTE